MDTLKKPHILVCNDDGIEGEGIHALAAAMKKIGRVSVVAPAEPHSAMSHAMTLGSPLRIKKFLKNGRFFWIYRFRHAGRLHQGCFKPYSDIEA